MRVKAQISEKTTGENGQMKCGLRTTEKRLNLATLFSLSFPLSRIELIVSF